MLHAHHVDSAVAFVLKQWIFLSSEVGRDESAGVPKQKAISNGLQCELAYYC